MRLAPLLLVLLAGCGNPSWRFDRYTVTGQIDADGGCTVVVEGDTLMRPATARLDGPPMRAGLGSGSLSMLTCTASADAERLAGPGAGTFILDLAHRGEIAGDYRLSWAGGDPTSPGTAGAAVFHDRWADDGWSGAGAYLRARDGRLSIRGDPVGGFRATFSFMARRKSRFG